MGKWRYSEERTESRQAADVAFNLQYHKRRSAIAFENSQFCQLQLALFLMLALCSR